MTATVLAAELRVPAEPWMAEARCRTVPDWLTLPEYRQLSDCGRCPVAEACLDYALRLEPTTREARFGVVYGGLSGAERALLLGAPRAKRGGHGSTPSRALSSSSTGTS